MEGINEALIKSFLDAFSDGFSSVGNDGFAVNQRFLNAKIHCMFILIHGILFSVTELSISQSRRICQGLGYDIR